MDAKRLFRTIAKVTLLDTVFEFAYWIAAVAGLVLLGTGSLEGRPVLLAAALALYCAAVTLLYFFIVKRLKRFFGAGEGR
jgi:predicted tellurium resistance membrane protein TerC